MITQLILSLDLGEVKYLSPHFTTELVPAFLPWPTGLVPPGISPHPVYKKDLGGGAWKLCTKI